MYAAIKGAKLNDKFQDPLYLFLELVRAGVMHGHLWSGRAFSGGPSFGTGEWLFFNLDLDLGLDLDALRLCGWGACGFWALTRMQMRMRMRLRPRAVGWEEGVSFLGITFFLFFLFFRVFLFFGVRASANASPPYPQTKKNHACCSLCACSASCR
jgi:hypothetical protein